MMASSPCSVVLVVAYVVILVRVPAQGATTPLQAAAAEYQHIVFFFLTPQKIFFTQPFYLRYKSWAKRARIKENLYYNQCRSQVWYYGSN